MSASADNPEAGGGSTRRAAYTARIERIFDHTADTRSLFLRIADSAGFNFIPGQFISIVLPLGDGVRVRPYSIASSPEDGQPLEICLNLVPGGAGSRYLFSLGIGDRLSFTGPFGRFTLDRAPDVETVFIAESTAIAPIRPMLRRALADRHHPPLSLHHAAPTEEGLLYRREFEESVAGDSRFSFEPILIDPPPPGWTGPRGRLIDHVERLYVKGDNDRSRRFYICGVGQPVFDLRDLLRGAGYERRAVQYERW
jgi:phenol hydroxylase P5 protein